MSPVCGGTCSRRARGSDADGRCRVWISVTENRLPPTLAVELFENSTTEEVVALVEMLETLVDDPSVTQLLINKFRARPRNRREGVS